MLDNLVEMVLHQNLGIYPALDLQPYSPISLKDKSTREKFTAIFSELLNAINLDGIDGWIQIAYKKENESLKTDLETLKETFGQKSQSLAIAKSTEIKDLVERLGDLCRRFNRFKIYEESYNNSSVKNAVRGMIIQNLKKLTDPRLISNKKRKETYLNEGDILYSCRRAYIADGYVIIVKQHYDKKRLDAVLVTDIIGDNFPLAVIAGREINCAIPELMLEKECEITDKKDGSKTIYRYIMTTPDGSRKILCKVGDGKTRLGIKRGRIYQAIISFIGGEKNGVYGNFLNQSSSNDNLAYDVHPKLAEYNRGLLLKQP